MPTEQVPSTITMPSSSTTKRLRAHRPARSYPRQVLLRVDHAPWREPNTAPSPLPAAIETVPGGNHVASLDGKVL